MARKFGGFLSLNYSTEEGFEPGYTESINELIKTFEQNGVSSTEAMELLLKRDIK
jgi:hypothetical protein